jgi:hypothetical protein
MGMAHPFLLSALDVSSGLVLRVLLNENPFFEEMRRKNRL